MLYYEHKLKKQGYDFIIGVDEAGRGPLAGPVVAAAASLLTLRFKNRIDDSKKLTPALREKAFQEIIQKSIFGIGIVEEKAIDCINIFEASRQAMKEAIAVLLKKLGPKKVKRHTHIIVDGNMRLDLGLPCLDIINGDSKSKSIAAASILAKVIRDRIMFLYDRLYPDYGFLQHKGYPTRMHRDIVRRLGPSLIHRTSFCCV